MKRFLTVLAGLLVLAALAVVTLPFVVPQSYLERQLAPVLADATGLELQEARRLKVSLMPAPGIAFEGVSATLPLDDTHNPLIRADRIVAAIDTRELLNGRLKLRKVTLEAPSVVLHSEAGARSDAGAPDRGLHKAVAGGDGPDFSRFLIKVADGRKGRKHRGLLLPSVDIAIVNGSMAMQDPGSGGLAVTDGNFELISHPDAGEAALEGGLKIGGEPVTVKGSAQAPAQSGGRTAALRLTITSAAGETRLDGALSLGDQARFSGPVQIELTSGEALARMFGGSRDALARFDGARIAGRFDVSETQIGLSEGTLSAPGVNGEITAIGDFSGTVEAKLRNLSLHGGQGQGTFMLDARQPDAILAASFSMSGVDALALNKGVSGFDWLSGRADASFDVAGGGRSLDAMVETLKGHGKIMVANGAIEGLDLPLIVADAKNGEFGKWRREAGRQTPFDRMEASFTLENGIANTDDLTMTGPNIAVTGEGKTNIARGRINYKLKTKVTARDGNAAGDGEKDALAIPLIIKGDWDKPDIYPDFKNAMEDEESLRGTAKLFGKSVEKLTDGQIKSDDFGKMIDGLFGKKKKKKKLEDTQ